ncbi:MAG: hypothetical protein ABEI74_01550, partial [Candidatus Pacearchaeota archaeon]
NYSYLSKIREVVKKHKRKYDFVIVCGGGSLARKYISALEKDGKNKKLWSFAGIAATRSNAKFVNYFFGKEPKKGIPTSVGQIKQRLKDEGIVITGALQYGKNSTSDSDSAKIAREIKAEFVNLTDVKGLYDKNPKKSKNAKLIKEITWKDFDKKARDLSYKPGQHFVLDQTASEIIKKSKIPTYIIQNPSDLDKFLKGEKFTGTIVRG